MTIEYYADPRLAEAYDAGMGAEADAMLDTPFYLALAQHAAARDHAVLDLACGTGRITLPLARAGIDVTGLDNAPAMLDVARRKAAAEGLELTWVEADMRNFELDRLFGLIVMPYRSFLHLLTAEDQASCLTAVHRHLVPGGRFALNLFTPPFRVAGAQAPVLSRIYKRMRLRYVQPDEMRSLLTAAGFDIEAAYGGFLNEPLTDSSSEMVWLARRR